MTRSKPTDTEWAEAAARYPVGSVVEAPVAEVWPFGIFVALPGVALVGFVPYPNLDPAGTPVRPGSSEVPQVGEQLTVVVLDHQADRSQLWCSCKLADFPEPEQDL